MAQQSAGEINRQIRPDRGAEFFDQIIRYLNVFFIKSGRIFSLFGETVFHNIDIIATYLFKIYSFFEDRLGYRISRVWQRTRKKNRVILHHFTDFLLRPFRRTKHCFLVLVNAVTITKGQAFSARLLHFMRILLAGIRNNTRVYITILNYVTPVLGIWFLVASINWVNSMVFSVKVTYNGQELGYVKSESVVNDAKDIVQGRMVYLDDSEYVDILPSYSIEMVRNEDVLTEYQLADAMIQLSGDEMLQAQGLYIDGEFYGALEDGSIIQATLDNILEQYQGDDVDSVRFLNNIEVLSGLYLTNNIRTSEDIVGLLTSQVQAESYYTVVDGDTPLGVAEKTGMNYGDLKALNPNIEDNSYFRAGLQLLLTKAESFLPVEVQKTIVYNETIPFETEITESDKYAKGTENVDQEGENGENQITAKVTYVNGSETSREILSTQVLKEPVTRKVTKGVAELAVVDADYDGVVSNSGFAWPMNGCYVSSPYGSRWNTTHGGIDLCIRGGTMGKPIYASAGGTVIFAANSGGYGKLVKIRHSNGVETWYAHTSSMVVSPGQVVSQGQLIAYAGATGQVTGPHLHFELRINGIRKNPLNYLP